MGKSRNERHRNEGTFLEGVQTLLKSLAEDIKGIKLCIDEMGKQQFPSAPQYYSADLDACFSNWIDCFSPMDNFGNHHCWNVLAKEFSPAAAGDCSLSFSKIELLKFRFETSEIFEQSPWIFPVTQASVSDELDYEEPCENGHDGQQRKDSDGTSQNCSFPIHSLGEETAEDRCGKMQAGDTELSHCQRCRRIDCVCEDIMCLRCAKSAEVCQCIVPDLQLKICSDCGYPQPHKSLYEKSLWDLPLLDYVKCLECKGTNLETNDFYWLEASAHRCDHCLRRDGQGILHECSNIDCVMEGLYHLSCMTEVAPTYFVCEVCRLSGNLHFATTSSEHEDSHDELEDGDMSQQCSDDGEVARHLNSDARVADGKPPATQDFEGDSINSVRDSDDEMQADKDTLESGLTNGEQPRNMVRLWNEDEILVWVQVTLKMMDRDASQNVLAQRWNVARCHIPPDKRTRLQHMLEERFDACLCEEKF